MKILEGKVVIITGGSSGIGKAAAQICLREGARVAIADINEEAGNKTVSAFSSSGGEAIFVKADSSNPEDNKRLVKEVVAKFGGLHVAVNNAGIGGQLAATADYGIDSWQKVIDINLSGVFYGMHYQIPAMLASGGGSIINVASILGMAGTRQSPAYVAAKHGVVGLTKATALEYASQNIRVNSIGPGYISTPLLDALDKETLNMLIGLHPIGRLGKSEEVGELVAWLASDKASFVTGGYYPVDGGYLAQ